MSVGEIWGKIWQIAKIIYAALLLTAAAVIVIFLLVSAEQQQQDLSESLTVTIIILVGAILTAASLATVMHEFFARSGRPDPGPYRAELGPVFERYVKWFSYVIGPVMVSYGVVRIIEVLK